MSQRPDSETLHEEIGAALAEDGPSEEDRAEWAREALARAGELPGGRPQRRRSLLLTLGAAAVAAAILLIVLLKPPVGTGDGEDPPVTVTAAAVDEARKVNEAALASAEVKKRLADAPEGFWAGIALGELIALEPELQKVLEVLDSKASEEAHRFIFQVGTEGDATYETTWPYEQVVGMKFLNEMDLTFGSGPDGFVFWRGKDMNAKRTVPSPDGRPFLSLLSVEPRAASVYRGFDAFYLLATGYSGPLILPDGKTFPQTEIPGLATVKDMFQGTRVYRRQLVDAWLGALGHLHVEALGDRQTPPTPLEFDGITWRRHGAETWDKARRTRKHLLLLVHDVSGMLPVDAFEGLGKRLGQFVTANHVIRWEDPFGLTGRPFANPAELVAYRIEGPKDERTVAHRLLGRLPLTVSTSAADVEQFLAPLASPMPMPAGPEPRDVVRRRNAAVLETPATKSRLAGAPKGSYAAIGAGRLLIVDPDIRKVRKVLNAFMKTGGGRNHAFLFKVGTEGDVVHETTWPYEQVAGTRFLAESGVIFRMGRKETAFWMEDDPPKDLADAARFPTPDGRPFLPLQLWPARQAEVPDEGEAVTRVFAVSTGYNGPLILPDGLGGFGRIEIPGYATVKDMQGSARIYRRVLLRVRAPAVGLDALVEALTDRQTPAPELAIGGVMWPRHSESRIWECLREKRLLLLIAVDASTPFSVVSFGEGELAEDLNGFVRAVHVTPWTLPSGVRRASGTFQSPELVICAPAEDLQGFTIVSARCIQDQSPESLRKFLEPFLNGGKYRDRLEAMRNRWGK